MIQTVSFVTSFLLTAVFVAIARTSLGVKCAVIGLTTIYACMHWWFPSWWIPSILLQAGVDIYILSHFKAQGEL